MDCNNGSVLGGGKALLHGWRLWGLSVVEIPCKPRFNIFTNTPTIDPFHWLTVEGGKPHPFRYCCIVSLSVVSLENGLLDNLTLEIENKREATKSQDILWAAGDPPSSHHRSCLATGCDAAAPCSEFCSCVPLGKWKRLERRHWYYNIALLMSNAGSRPTKTASSEASSWWLRLNL